jgi:hypothetical protein
MSQSLFNLYLKMDHKGFFPTFFSLKQCSNEYIGPSATCRMES